MATDPMSLLAQGDPTAPDLSSLTPGQAGASNYLSQLADPSQPDPDPIHPDTPIPLSSAPTANDPAAGPVATGDPIDVAAHPNVMALAAPDASTSPAITMPPMVQPPAQAADPLRVDPVDTGLQPAVPAPHKRMSFLSILGKISDGVAVAGGQTPGYQGTLDANTARTVRAQQDALDTRAKGLDIQQTGEAVATAHSARVAAFARGVQALGQGGRPVTAAQAQNVAGQLFPDDPKQAQALVHLVATDPDALTALASADKTGAAGRVKFGNNAQLFTDPKTGKLTYGQFADDGSFKAVDTGGLTPAPALKFNDQGNVIQASNTRTGETVGAPLAVSGKPGEGEQATSVGTVPGTGIPAVSYKAPAAGSHAALVDADIAAGTGQKLAATDNTRVRTQAAQQKAVDTKNSTLAKLNETRDTFGNIYQQMDQLAANPDLKYALGAVAGRIPDPRGEAVRGQIARLSGDAVAGAIQKLKGANGSVGVRIGSEKELLTLQQGLVGAINNTKQSPDQYIKNIRAAQYPIKRFLDAIDGNISRFGSPAAATPAAAVSSAGWGKVKVH